MHREGGTKRVAIACQGGGSHTAFTAGALKTILEHNEEKYEIAALSGTSGGAICALFAWYGLLVNDGAKAASLLDSFWADISANSFWDASQNNFIVGMNRLQGDVVLPQVSPYFYPPSWQDRLRRTLRKYFPFEMLEELVKPSSPTLLVSAVDVLSGDFTVFRSHRFFGDRKKAVNRREDGISLDAILASAALPTLVRAVRVGGGVYWDGLFSQNPPIRDFVEGIPDAREKPDEIWIVQINPEKRRTEPTSMVDIWDRRNELAGNLSMKQEESFIHTVNGWVEEGYLPGDRYRPVQVRSIEILAEEVGGERLDHASKLNRDPSFIKAMAAYGEKQAKDFLERLP